MGIRLLKLLLSVLIIRGGLCAFARINSQRRNLRSLFTPVPRPQSPNKRQLCSQNWKEQEKKWTIIWKPTLNKKKGGSIFPWCVLMSCLLVMSWNTTNENPSTDKLSRAINYTITRLSLTQTDAMTNILFDVGFHFQLIKFVKYLIVLMVFVLNF